LLFLFPSGKPIALDKTKVINEEISQAEHQSNIAKTQKRILWIGSFLFIGLNVLVRGTIAVVETLGTPIFLHVYHPSNEVEATSIMFSILGVIGLIFYFSIDYMLKLISETTLLSIGFALAAIGSLCLVNLTSHQMTIYQFFAGAAFVWSFGSPITQVLVISTFSILLGPIPQGAAMGYMGSAGSIGRIIFPFIAGLISANISFACCGALMILASIAVLCYRYYTNKQHQRINTLLMFLGDEEHFEPN
jgi:MFS family permease